MARFTHWLARPTPSRRRPIRLEQLENREVPAVITVNSLADNITVDGLVTLREAIQAAETDTSVDGSTAGSGADIIRFDPTLFGQTINLSLVGDTTFGPTALSISSDITIDGLTGYTSGSGVTIARDSGVSNLRLFLVTSTGSLTLEGVTLSGGRAVGEDGGTSVNYGGGGGGGAAGFGGAVFNQGVLSITSSTLTGNQAQGGNSGVAFDSGVGAGTGGIGGGPTGGAGGVPGLPIAPDAGDGGFGSGGGGGGYERGKGGTGGFGGGGGGAATGIVGGVRGDAGFGGGAGGFNFGGGTAGSNGGAGAGMGGAVFNHGGILVLTNSTLAGNAAVGGTGSGTADSGAGMGGGVFSRNGSVTILNSTISGNTSAQGGRGVFLVGDGATVTYAVNNTIVGEANTTVTDVVVQTINSGSTSASGGNNIIRSTSGVSGLTGTLTADPVLGSLTNNGGPTPTMAIGTSSPAVNAGSNAALGGLSKDQRNMTVGRIDGTAVDIGAYELDIIPAVVSVSVPANGTYLASQNLDFTVTFDDTVVVTGVPRIALTVGGSTVYANYQSGTGTTALQFRYTVQAGDADADGIAMTSPIDLNSGTIQDPTGNNATLTFTPPNTSAVRVDAAPPTVASHTWPANATYVAGQHLDFTITYSENVTVTGTPRIPLTIGSTPVFANYLTGSGGTSITFRYTVQTGDLDTDGILVSLLEMNGGTIRDAAGNDADSSFGYPSTAGVRVDAVTPTVASVTGPTNGSYRGGQSLDFTVNFSEAVNVTGTPRIALTVGTNTVFATYQSGSGSTALLFRYTVQAGDTDADGIAVISPIDLNGGLISDLVANNAVLTFTPPDTSSVLVDTTTPAVSSVVRVGGATTNAGSVQYTVTFSESVTGVDVSDFMLTTTGAVSGASVTGVSGSGTTYTVTVDTGTGDGTIRLDVNTAAGTDAAGNTSTGFSASEVYSIDKTAPTVVSVVRVSSATTYSPTVQFTVTFSEDMTGVDLSDFTLSATDLTGASVLSVSGSGTTFTVTVGTGSNTASTAGTLRLDVNSASSTDV
ncbi:MAG: hypothetical protein MUF18_17800, partial [Fimbriiglobus sp.]|nr:hypothetical protein [Fimbriiglobus sp.]